MPGPGRFVRSSAHCTAPNGLRAQLRVKTTGRPADGVGTGAGTRAVKTQCMGLDQGIAMSGCYSNSAEFHSSILIFTIMQQRTLPFFLNKDVL